MSEISIFDKSQEIRFETELYANTCERVADVLDDINDTKANKTDVAQAIQVVVDEMTQMEQEIYGYVDGEVTTLELAIANKMDKPSRTDYEMQYFVVSSEGVANYRPITLFANRVPVWTGNTFYNSPLYVSTDSNKVGVNMSNPIEALDVAGYVKADAFRFNVTSSNSVPNKIWTDGTDLYHTNAAGVNVKMSGQNISNADLTNTAARTFTQAAAFTWNTAGQPHYLKGLLDKTGNAAYTKALIIHPTTGEKVTRDFADPAATTLAVQNASTAQKTAMRTALLGTATPANPALQGVTSSFIEKNVETIIGIYGLNLTLLDPSFIYIELPDLTKIYATNFANINQYLVRVTWLIPNTVPNGNYAVKIQNGVAVQGLSKANINILNGGLVKYVFKANEWIIRRKNEAPTTGVIKSNDYLRFPLENAGYRAKSNNVFSGSISAQWEFSVVINREISSGGGSFKDLTYFFGLTPTSNTDFSTYESMMFNNGLSLKTDGFDLFDNLNNSLISNFLAGVGTIRIYVTKPTGSKAYFFIENNNNFYFMQTFDLDPLVVYAMFLYKPNKDGSNNLGFECFFESKIVN